MVSYGISYDNSDDESDDKKMDMIDQQDHEFATRMARAKTDHKRLKIILSHPALKPKVWAQPAEITDIGIETRHGETTLKTAHTPVSKRKRNDYEIAETTAEMPPSKRKRVNETFEITEEPTPESIVTVEQGTKEFRNTVKESENVDRRTKLCSACPEDAANFVSNVYHSLRARTTGTRKQEGQCQQDISRKEY